jgi:aryl-alcohol dehydrogenase-like predicted oxidoreductase
MRQVQLGGSELRVSQLGLGTMTFGERSHAMSRPQLTRA